jgi:thiamine transporter ThiT
MKKNTKKLVYSALCLALCLVLPFLIGQIPQIGQMLSPMHIPVFLCGFLCGWPWGLAVGFIAPLLRSVLFHMPAMYPGAISMAFELATYGAVSGLLYHLLPKKNGYIYVALIVAMLCGRVVWGIARYIMAGLSGSSFPWSAFLAGAFTNAIPGIILHIVLIPVLVMALKRARMVIND